MKYIYNISQINQSKLYYEILYSKNINNIMLDRTIEFNLDSLSKFDHVEHKIEQVDKLEIASEERILQILDQIIDEGKYTPPDPFMDLELATLEDIMHELSKREVDTHFLFYDGWSFCIGKTINLKELIEELRYIDAVRSGEAGGNDQQ